MRTTAATLIVAVTLGAAWARSGRPVAGKWKLDTSSHLTGNAKMDRVLKDAAEFNTLHLNSDGSFSWSLMQGTYTVSGATLRLKVTKRFDRGKPNQTIRAKLSSDGKTLTFPSEGSPKPTIYRKTNQPVSD